MSVSKVIRNPIGTGGDVDLSGHLVALGEIHGGSLVSDDFVNAQGDITTNGNLAVGQTGTFNDLVTVVAHNGHVALDVAAQPGTNQNVQFWRDGTGAVKAVMQAGGALECLGGFQSGGPILIEPAIGGGIQMMWIENGGVIERVTGLTALQSIRVNAAGTAVEAYDTSSSASLLFLKRVNNVSLTAAPGTETVIFNIAQNNFLLSRVILRCRTVDTTGAPTIQVGQAGGATGFMDIEVTSVAFGSSSSNTMYQVIYPRAPSGLFGLNGAQALFAGTNYVVRVVASATGGGGNCVVDVIVEGFYLAL